MTLPERNAIVAAMLAMVPPKEYSYRVPGIIAERFPLETLTLKLGVKVSFTFSHHRGIPVHMEAMRGRGWAILEPVPAPEHQRHLMVDGIPYMMDPCGSERVDTAIRLAVTAFVRSESPAKAAELLGQGGICCCCGAHLTDPVSISRGIGPECFRKTHAAFFLRESFG